MNRGTGMNREPPGMAVHEARMRLALRQAKLAASSTLPALA